MARVAEYSLCRLSTTTTDIKKVKQDIRVLTKTKETLEKEKEVKEKELQPLDSFPEIFVNVQKLKQQYETFQRQSALFNSYKSTLRQIAYRKNKIESISNALDAFHLFPERVHNFALLQSYIHCYNQVQRSKESLKNLTCVLDRITEIQPNIKVCTTLSAYLKAHTRFTKNKELLNNVTIPDTKTILLLQQYLKVLVSRNKSKEVITKTEQQIKDVHERICTVDVCPLCNQPICNH